MTQERMDRGCDDNVCLQTDRAITGVCPDLIGISAPLEEYHTGLL